VSRVCVIGDSHTGALRRAVMDPSRPKPVESLRFFAAPTETWKHLRPQGGRLVAGTDELRQSMAAHSHGRDSIELDQYDQFIVIGLGFAMAHMVGLYRMNCCDSIADPKRQKRRLSDGCFVAATAGLLLNTWAMRVARLIRSVTDKPITVVSTPNPAAGLPESYLPAGFPPFYDAVRDGVADAFGMLFRVACDRLARQQNLRIVPPPPEVAENGVFNHREFSLLPEDIESVPERDRMGWMLHGNAQYGVALIGHVFPSPAGPSH